jgi:hypothetical protein
MLVCRSSEARADTRIRLEEITLVDWAEIPDPMEDQTVGIRPETPLTH